MAEVDQGKEWARQAPQPGGQKRAASGDLPVAAERVNAQGGTEHVDHGEDRVVPPGPEEQAEPGQGVKDLRRGVGEKGLTEGGARVPEGPGARYHGPREGCDLGVPHEADDPIIEDASPTN